MNKVTPKTGVSVTAPAFSNNGHMFTAHVIAGNPVREYDSDFVYIRDVVTSTIGFSRAFSVSSDGLNLYWAGYTNGCIFKYTRTDSNSPFNPDYSKILKGFSAESFCWYPNSEILWVSAGSGTDLPNTYPDTVTYYSQCTWYAYDISDNTIIDSIKWNNLVYPQDQRPRAIGFSPNGKTAYAGTFGPITDFEGIQKFSKSYPVNLDYPNGGERFMIGYTDTIKWQSTGINNVKLEYSTNSGSSWVNIVNSVPAGSGKYAWLVPDAQSVNCLIRISDAANNSIYDLSDSEFTISLPPVISVLPASISLILNEGDSVDSTLQIDNVGLGILYFDVTIKSKSGNNQSLLIEGNKDGILGGVDWLTAKPYSGMIMPGNSQNVKLKITTDNLNNGDFSANVIISSNDPVHEIISVPVNLNVIKQPNLVYPDSVNFGKVFTGFSKTADIKLLNNGSAALQVERIHSSTALFTIKGPTAFTIEPEESYMLPVIFSPEAAGQFSEILTITTNDPSSPAEIVIYGEGIYPPKISAAPDSFYYELNVGDTISTDMIIYNTGPGNLTFEISDRNTLNKKPSEVFEHVKRKKTLSLYDGNEDTYLRRNLHVIITDPIGDAVYTDIKEIRGNVQNDTMNIEFEFRDDMVLNDSISARLFIDMDQNPETGSFEPDLFHDLGIDCSIEYSPLSYNYLLIYSHASKQYFTVPFTEAGSIISFSVPLEYMGFYNGNMSMMARAEHPTRNDIDWAPDEGHGVLMKEALWLTEFPTAGNAAPGENFTINLSAHTGGLIGGNYTASIDIFSNDPVNSILSIPFGMKLTGTPEITVEQDSLIFGPTYIGYYKSLFLHIANTGTDTLKGSVVSGNPLFKISEQDFSLPVNGIKDIEVRFYPINNLTVNSALTISSNSPSSTHSVMVSGNGIEAPHISVSSKNLEFQSNGGDTIYSEFIVYNKGGSDLMVELKNEVLDSTFAPEKLFGTLFENIFELSVADGSVIRSIPTPVLANPFSTGLAYSGDYIYFHDFETSSDIFVLNPSDGAVIKSFPPPDEDIYGLAYIKPYLYVLCSKKNLIKVLNAETGALIKTLQLSITNTIGLDGADKTLFTSDLYNIYKLNTENGSVEKSFKAVNIVEGIGYTGKRLFTSFPLTGIDEYDPVTGEFIRNFSSAESSGLAGGGNTDADWLNENPAALTISAHDSAVVHLTITPPAKPGTSMARIILTSNDPDSQLTTVNISMTVISGTEDGLALPVSYALHNNYPNPFNPTTTIRYDLPEQGTVTLKLYNTLGEEIATLVNEEKPAGSYEVQFNAKRLSSGVYIYALKAGSYTNVRKMILLK